MVLASTSTCFLFRLLIITINEIRNWPWANWNIILIQLNEIVSLSEDCRAKFATFDAYFDLNFESWPDAWWETTNIQQYLRSLCCVHRLCINDRMCASWVRERYLFTFWSMKKDSRVDKLCICSKFANAVDAHKRPTTKRYGKYVDKHAHRDPRHLHAAARHTHLWRQQNHNLQYPPSGGCSEHSKQYPLTVYFMTCYLSKWKYFACMAIVAEWQSNNRSANELRHDTNFVGV